ncbi:MAG: hypothetical protein WAW61_20100 [Methylococcaceae bacterium]
MVTYPLPVSYASGLYKLQDVDVKRRFYNNKHSIESKLGQGRLRTQSNTDAVILGKIAGAS